MKKWIAFLLLSGAVYGQIVVIQGSDKPKDSRVVINSNFSYLDVTKLKFSKGAGVPVAPCVQGTEAYTDTTTRKAYWCTDTNTWSEIGMGTATGDVTGPAGAVPDNFASFSGASGKAIKDSGKKTTDFATAGHTHAGMGDVVGPGAAVNNNFAVYDGATGKLLKDGGSKASDFATSGHNHAGVYEPVITVLGGAKGGTNQNVWTAAKCVRVSNDGTKLESAADDCGGHAQNTDTGTTQQTWQLHSGAAGPKLKNSASVLEVRNATDTDYADLKVKTLSTTGTGPEEMTEQAAPAAPGAGTLYGWADSTNKGRWSKESGGNSFRDAKPVDCGANFVQKFNNDGTFTCVAASPLTTKGDLHGFTTVDARVAVGADGQVLTADSTQAAGIKWAAASGGGSTTDVLNLPFGSCDNGNVLRSGLWGSPTSGGLSLGGAQACHGDWVLTNPVMTPWNQNTELGLLIYAPFLIPANVKTATAPVFKIKGVVGGTTTGNVKLSAKLACQADDTNGQTALTWSAAATSEVNFTATNLIIKDFAMTLAWPAGCAASQTTVLALARVAASADEYGGTIFLFDGQFTYGVQ